MTIGVGDVWEQIQQKHHSYGCPENSAGTQSPRPSISKPCHCSRNDYEDPGKKSPVGIVGGNQNADDEACHSFFGNEPALTIAFESEQRIAFAHPKEDHYD